MTAVSQWSPCLLHVSQTCEFYSSKANQRLRFSLLSFILTDLLGNSTLLHGFKRSWFVICDWWISIRFVCFCVSRFVACDRNYDWRQQKTQLWKWLLNLRVRMFVKSTVNYVQLLKHLSYVWGLKQQRRRTNTFIRETLHDGQMVFQDPGSGWVLCVVVMF